MEPDRFSEPQFRTIPYRATPVVRSIVVLSMGVWFLQLTLASAADVRALLGFATSDLDAWWTVMTYPFVHGSGWLLALNMYALWLFGSRVESQWGSPQFGWYYALCAVGGWLAQVLFVREGVLVGSTGAVMAVMFAYATRWGNDRVMVLGLMPVPARWVAGVFILVNLTVALTGVANGEVASLAHFGSLVAAWGYLRMAGTVDIDRVRQHVAPVADEPDDVPPRAIPPRTTPRKRDAREARDVDEIVQQSQAAIAERTAKLPSRDSTPVATNRSSLAELNALLDKISARGLDALTQVERDRLEEAARRLRDS